MSVIMKRKIFITILIIPVVYVAYAVLRPLPHYHPPKIELAADFDTFYQQQLAISKQAKARPNNEERLVRYSKGLTDYAILYIHGFGASRAEGEYSIDRLAAAIKANTYYIRLPGHGTNIEDHVQTPFQEYLAVAEKTLAHMPLLGKKVIVIGTSMGGMVATWLAAQHPDKVQALILASPFYDYVDPTAKILWWPGGVSLGELIIGKYRVKAGSRGPKTKEGYESYWYVPQYLAAIYNLQQLKEFASREEVFTKVKVPVLLLVYYQDEQHQDETASVLAMRKAFALFSTPENQKRLVEIVDGNHVLFSEWVRTDKEKVHQHLLEFVKSL